MSNRAGVERYSSKSYGRLLNRQPMNGVTLFNKNVLVIGMLLAFLFRKQNSSCIQLEILNSDLLLGRKPGY